MSSNLNPAPKHSARWCSGAARKISSRIQSWVVSYTSAAYAWWTPAYTQYLTPFVILLRSPDDFTVTAAPPWWNRTHIVAVAAGLLILAIGLHFLYSRAERWKLGAVFKERERLAAEMHDTLAQSFAGIGFQIQAVRNGTPEELQNLHHQLDVATELVRHSHEEARRSIAALRPARPDRHRRLAPRLLAPPLRIPFG